MPHDLNLCPWCAGWQFTARRHGKPQSFETSWALVTRQALVLALSQGSKQLLRCQFWEQGGAAKNWHLRPKSSKYSKLETSWPSFWTILIPWQSSSGITLLTEQKTLLVSLESLVTVFVEITTDFVIFRTRNAVLLTVSLGLPRRPRSARSDAFTENENRRGSTRKLLIGTDWPQDALRMCVSPADGYFFSFLSI